MVEVEEYLNSGGYEMSDKKYPYIGRNKNGQINIVYSNTSATHIGGGFEGEHFDNYNDFNTKNIGREYLTNTYGKCESQEHADFICELAEGAGILAVNEYSTDRQLYFSCNGKVLGFHSEKTACDEGEKLIHLPLPQKDKEMSETKPVYTKEMHERGELPPVGSYFTMNNTPDHFHFSKFNGLPCEVLALTEYEDGVVVTFNNEKEGFGALWHNEGMEPTPTIEDEFKEFIRDSAAHMNIDELHKSILTKYNITPKDS